MKNKMIRIGQVLFIKYFSVRFCPSENLEIWTTFPLMHSSSSFAYWLEIIAFKVGRLASGLRLEIKPKVNMSHLLIAFGITSKYVKRKIKMSWH
jgi:hypothetical protein